MSKVSNDHMPICNYGTDILIDLHQRIASFRNAIHKYNKDISYDDVAKNVLDTMEKQIEVVALSLAIMDNLNNSLT